MSINKGLEVQAVSALKTTNISKQGIMNDFASNVDLEAGIVFDSEKAQLNFEAFKKKYSVNDVKGNIFVAGR